MPHQTDPQSINNLRGLNETLNQTANTWQLRSLCLSIGRLPLVMGIVNVTPDSFSDGGTHDTTDAAIEHAKKLAEQGADILDIGGESTRPYSAPVAEQQELDRVIPVIEKLTAHTNIPISIDTSKAAVAKAAIQAGAQIINDVTGFEGDPAMMRVAVDTQAGICAMHMQGTPQTMQDNPRYNDVVGEILNYLTQRKTHLLESGIDLERICLDPGIGFGKTHQHNLQLLAASEQFHQLGCPILIGHSRKGFIGKILGNKETSRDVGTRAITLMLAQKGIQIVRVHEVKETVEALKILNSVGGIDGQVLVIE